MHWLKNRWPKSHLIDAMCLPTVAWLEVYRHHNQAFWCLQKKNQLEDSSFAYIS